MKHNQNIRKVSALCCACALATGTSQAALTIQDGDFQASPAGSFVANSGWWEQNNISDNNAEFIKAESDSNSPQYSGSPTTNVFAAFGTVINTSPKTGRLYQNIGMYSGETSIQIGFTAIDLTNQAFAPLTVEIWYGGTAANAADGATLDTTIGASLASAVTYTSTDITNNAATNLVATLNFTGATSGDAIWLSFGKLTAGTTVAGFDNVSIVPEPSSALLLGIGALALLRRKR